MTPWIIAAAGLFALGLVAVAVLIGLRRSAKTAIAGGGSSLTPVRADKLQRFVENTAGFVVTTAHTFDASPERVWAALDTNGFFSWLPLINGMRYPDQDRGVGATRVFDGFLVAGAEQVVAREEGHRLALTATTSSVPFAVKSIAEEYVLSPTDSGATTLTWTLAAQPRLGWLLPYQLFAPLARPFARWSLRGLASRL
ncbi:SRPBCC family protein [Nocardia sp. NPDC052316]|uniref:SRPBCC family protein n=1 Tax=Nocardia sp. NPDC052316 TaxID=3364329 RepID=UPI0037C78BAD